MSQDFEAPVLSILLEYPQAFDDVADRLKACHFAQDTHRLVFAELSRQIASGKGCDALTIANALDGEVSAAEVLTIAACHNHSARGLARMVDGLIERYKGRQLHALSVKLQDLAYNDAPVQERLDMAGAELARLVDDDTADEWVDAHTAAIEHLDVLEKREQGQITGWPTGLQDFDELLDGGLQPGNLVVIGARPAMGKTALAMTIGLSMASTRPVGLLSMEMPHADVRDRQAAILSRASIGQIKRPTRGLDFGRIVEGVERTKALQWYVSDKSGLNILQVRAKARQLKRKKGLDVPAHALHALAERRPVPGMVSNFVPWHCWHVWLSHQRITAAATSWGHSIPHWMALIPTCSRTCGNVLSLASMSFVSWMLWACAANAALALASFPAFVGVNVLAVARGLCSTWSHSVCRRSKAAPIRESLHPAAIR